MIDVKRQVKNLKTAVVLYNKKIVKIIAKAKIPNEYIIFFLFLLKN